MTATTTITVTNSPLNTTRVIQSACTYLASNYNASMELIAEMPSHERYYLYSDNYLAVLVSPRDCNDPRLARSINETPSRYDASKIPNQFMVFSCRQYLNGAKDFNLSDHIWTTINNQSGTPLSESYPDIAFPQAYYDKTCVGNIPAAFAAFKTGANEYNGIGSNDTAFRTGQDRGVYQTYKLALYIFAARLLNQGAPLSALANLMRTRALSGGFYTGCDASFSNVGTFTNTETTCLAIMAMEAVFG
jgi:hypothetical protein